MVIIIIYLTPRPLITEDGAEVGMAVPWAEETKGNGDF